jgi:hypothetical protein
MFSFTHGATNLRGGVIVQGEDDVTDILTALCAACYDRFPG